MATREHYSNEIVIINQSGGFKWFQGKVKAFEIVQ